MAYPKQIHVWIQQRLARLMDRRAEPHGVAGMAIPFRPLAEYADYKIDVAFVSSAQTESGLTLQGSPGIIIEVFSPSNTASEMHDRRQLFFETGCLEFWGGSIPTSSKSRSPRPTASPRRRVGADRYRCAYSCGGAPSLSETLDRFS